MPRAPSRVTGRARCNRCPGEGVCVRCRPHAADAAWITYVPRPCPRNGAGVQRRRNIEGVGMSARARAERSEPAKRERSGGSLSEVTECSRRKAPTASRQKMVGASGFEPPTPRSRNRVHNSRVNVHCTAVRPARNHRVTVAAISAARTQSGRRQSDRSSRPTRPIGQAVNAAYARPANALSARVSTAANPTRLAMPRIASHGERC